MGDFLSAFSRSAPESLPRSPYRMLFFNPALIATRFRPARYGFSRTGLSPVGFFRKVSSAHWNPPLPSFAWRDDSLILPHDGKLLCENGESTEEESIPDALKLSFAEFRATDSARETQNSQPGFISYPWTGLFLSHGRWARIVL